MRNLGLVDGAKMLKKELKEKYPKVKFSVRTERYSGGCSLNVSYEDGPAYNEVDKVVKQYQYGNFNGMEDIYEYNNDAVKGCAKYVFVRREVSEAVKKMLNDFLKQEHGNHCSDYELDKCCYIILSKSDVYGEVELKQINDCGCLEDLYELVSKK